MPTQRLIFQGTGTDLANEVDEFVDQPKFLAYDDDFATARVQPELILKQVKMWKKLKSVQGNLSFSKAVALDCFKTLVERRGPDWIKGDASQWAEVMQNRFRAMGSHIHKAESATHPPKWVGSLPWVKENERSTAAAAEKSPEEPKAVEVTYGYGYDSEHEKGFRFKHGVKKKIEWATEMFAAADDADPGEGVWLKFADGTSKQLQDYTVAMLRRKEEVAQKDGSLVVHWTGTKDGKQLVLKPRKDRKSLISLYEDGAQILQCREDALDGLDINNTVVEVMTAIAKKYESGAVARVSLKQMKVVMMRDIKKEAEKASKAVQKAAPKVKTDLTKDAKPNSSESIRRVKPEAPGVKKTARAKANARTKAIRLIRGPVKDKAKAKSKAQATTTPVKNEGKTKVTPVKKEPETEAKGEDKAKDGKNDKKKATPVEAEAKTKTKMAKQNDSTMDLPDLFFDAPPEVEALERRLLEQYRGIKMADAYMQDSACEFEGDAGGC